MCDIIKTNNLGRYIIMLILCPECGKEISSKSKQCIYCGYPIEESSLGDNDLSDSRCPMCGVQKKHIIKDNIKEVCSVCGYMFNEEYVKNHKELLPDPKCPKCGSTAITAGQRGYSLLTGFLGSNKTVNRCANCGHTWKPGR
jgi:predicted Zn-ribbon and HTH transcriptional regulator